MRVTVANQAGACFGVQRALDLAEQATSYDAPVCTLGPLIHNPQVVASLEARGVSVAPDDAAITEGVAILRSHGVRPSVEQGLKDRGIQVLDATCPFVKNCHKHAARLAEEGYQVVIVGEHGHAEVEGTAEYGGTHTLVIQDVDELEGVQLKKRVGVVVQTTQSPDLLHRVVSKLLQEVVELRIYNTICAATSDRQLACAQLAQQVDAMVVIGGKNSGNTRRLAQIAQHYLEKTYHIETVSELEDISFDGVSHIGVTAGASTPLAQIDRVVEYLSSLPS